MIYFQSLVQLAVNNKAIETGTISLIITLPIDNIIPV